MRFWREGRRCSGTARRHVGIDAGTFCLPKRKKGGTSIPQWLQFPGKEV